MIFWKFPDDLEILELVVLTCCFVFLKTDITFPCLEIYIYMIYE